MKNVESYPYASGPILEEPNTYFYTPYGGSHFLKAWHQARYNVLGELPSPKTPTLKIMRQEYESMHPPYTTTSILHTLCNDFKNGMNGTPANINYLEKILKKFETTKHLHSAYGADWRAVDKTDYKNLRNYLLLGQVLTFAIVQSESLRYLNGLLKVMDTLCALRTQLKQGDQRWLAALIKAELRFVDKVCNQKGVTF